MKRFLIVVSAILLALLVSELIVRFVIGYPVYGVQYKVHYRKSGEYWTNIWKPYSRYWNVESGNQVFQRNNLGLPGIDVNIDNKINLAILGTSFLEAYQVNPNHIATSVLDSLLQQSTANSSVYNLGCSGHDPYELWFRLEYFEHQYQFSKVILVIETDFSNSWNRYIKPFSFEFEDGFGKKNENLLSNLLIKFRNISALNSLVVNGFKTIRLEGARRDKPFQGERSLQFTDELGECLLQYISKYHDNFAIVSITEDLQFNKDLESFCDKNEINFYSEPIFRQDIMIHGSGHLNEQGNQELGLLLFDAYKKFWSN